MPPEYVEDIFTETPRAKGSKCLLVARCAGIPGRSGIESFCKTAATTAARPENQYREPALHNPITPMKKASRNMAEKSVDTSDLRERKRRKPLEDVLPASSEDFSHARKYQTSLKSSQSSFYENDSDFFDLVNAYHEECEVEAMPDTQPMVEVPSPSPLEKNGSVSSDSSFWSKATGSSITSAQSDSSLRSRPLPTKLQILGQGSAASITNGPIAESPTTLTATSTHSSDRRLAIRPLSKQLEVAGRSSAGTYTSQISADGIIAQNACKVSTAPSPDTPAIEAAKPVASVIEKTTNGIGKMYEKDSSSELSPIIIAHDERVQVYMDRLGIARGVQHEIARGVTQGWWDWDSVTEAKLRQLVGANVEAARNVAQVLDTRHEPFLSPNSLEIYAELDREHKARLEGLGRGLGLMGAWEGVENWYGGRVQQIARLALVDDKKKSGPYKITLDKFEYGRSNRLTRFLGSTSVLQLRISDKIKKGEELIKYLARRFIICGRYFVPFHAKENKVYMAEIDENFQSERSHKLGDNLRLSWNKFIEWHNSLELNSQQPISKWSTRWALTLSTSRPALKFAPENIHLGLPDLYAGGERCTETMMTDGCGFMNHSALLLIGQALSLDACPVAVQGRIAGAKGVWLLHPDEKHRNFEEPPMIWIRDSQNKIKLTPPETWDRSHLIFDLVRIQRLTVPSSLYMQTIQNMSYNGVPDKVFIKLLEDGLLQEINPLTAWEGPKARTRLAKAVENAGGILGSRLSRLAGPEARVFGYIRDEDMAPGNADADEEEAQGLIERDSMSGCPVTLYEVTRELLHAGFDPLSSPLLRDKIKFIIKLVTNAYMEQYHIPVLQSAEAFIVPDPYGILEEDEIFFRSSKQICDPTTTVNPYTFLGPVLVTRNPTGVASDVRKVTAVSYDKLLSYLDVIIFSVKGSRSLASYLGGGDYDGDTVTIIADPTIVGPFKNSSIVNEPETLRTDFEREVEQVAHFQTRIERAPPLRREHELCKKLLLGLSDTKVGMYSQFHDNAVYHLGYDHPDTVRLAYMFTTCLDSSKTGLRVKPDVFKQDSLRWNRPRPSCMQKKVEKQRNLTFADNSTPLPRGQGLRPFVLDALKQSSKALEDDVLIRYENLCKTALQELDDALVEPFRSAERRAIEAQTQCPLLMQQLTSIKSAIVKLCGEYVTDLSEHSRKSPKKPTSRVSSFDSIRSTSETTASKSRTAIVHDYAVRFNQLEPAHLFLQDIQSSREIKASYAYIHAYQDRHGLTANSFPFDIAYRTICAIKARNEGGITVTQESADHMVTNAHLLKMFGK